jgi:hypothetical protein
MKFLKAKQIISLVGIFFIINLNVAVEEKTTVYVSLSDDMVAEGKEMSLTINDFSQTRPVKSKLVVFQFDQLFTKTTSIKIRYKDEVWQTPKELVGNGDIFINLYPGGINVRESARVTFKSSDGGLDVWINNQSYKTTICVTRVRPDESQKFQWKGDNNKVKCETTVTLSSGVRRTYTCDPKTGKVAEQKE